MPPLPNVNRVFKATVQFTGSTDLHNYENILHYGWVSGGPATSADMDAYASAIYGTYATYWMNSTRGTGVVSDLLTLKKVTCEDLTSPMGAVGEHAADTAGNQDSSFVPSVSVLISWKGGPRFRGGHPRTYLPGAAFSLLGPDGGLNPLIVDAAGDVAAQLNESVPGIGGTSLVGVFQCWVNYFTGFTSVQNPITLRWRNVPKVNAVPPVHAITSFAIQGNQKTQRRRLKPSPVVG